MKIEKSNNPAAVGALVLVLVIIVGRIIWMVFGHSQSAAASTVSAAAPAPNTPPMPVLPVTPAASATRTPGLGRVPAAAVPTTTRNPFSVAVRPTVAVSHSSGWHQTTMGGEAMPLTSLPPLPVRVLETGGGAGIKPSPFAHTSGAPAVHPIAATEPTEAASTLKLTAVVGGTEPMAVVQATNPEPIILHVGDFLDGMRVIAIHEQEIVFARGNGSWTLPLQSAADSAAGSASVTAVPAASDSAISVTTPEEKTNELQ